MNTFNGKPVEPTEMFHFYYVAGEASVGSHHWTTMPCTTKELNLADVRYIEESLTKQAKSSNRMAPNLRLWITSIIYLGYMSVADWNKDPYKEETPN